MKEKIQLIIDEYLKLFPNEQDRLAILKNYLKESTNEDLTDWNNKNGHLTAGAFVYCKSDDKFLVLYHKDLKMYLYPGGHMDIQDASPLETAKRELKEETGLENLRLIQLCNSGIPFDIDIHLIPFNDRVNMPEHYHFDFRYLFLLENLGDIIIDKDEFKDYKWISSSELEKDKNYGDIVKKLKRILDEKMD